MKKLVIKAGKYLFIIALLMGLHNSCEDAIDSQIPDVPLSFSINLDILNELTIPGNSMYFPGYGFAGVIVYCELENSYYAFDAGCTNEINSSCKVVADGLTGKCSCCESQYIFVGGYPSEGPASAPLRQYKTSLYGNTLRVYN